MLPFLIYEGKVAIVLAVFSLFYRLLLKRESFHRLNRVVLVGMMLVSFLLPMCVITIHKPMEMASQQIPEEVSSIAGIAGTASGAWWPMALSILFFVGVVFVLARELVSILSVLRIIRQGECVQEEYHQRLVTIHRNAIQQNPDNITGAMALSALEGLDPKVALSLVSTLSEEMKQNATVQALLPTLEARARTSIGDMFTDFEVVQDPADPHSAVKLSDYVGKGKTILLVFWASWCEENRKEMPELKNIYEKYHGDDFDIVSIAVSDAPENSLAAAKEMGIMWNLIVNAPIIPLETYGVRRIPDMILFGPDGTILLRNFWGYDDLILDSIIGRYLRGERPAQPGVL